MLSNTQIISSRESHFNDRTTLWTRVYFAYISTQRHKVATQGINYEANYLKLDKIMFSIILRDILCVTYIFQ